MTIARISPIGVLIAAGCVMLVLFASRNGEWLPLGARNEPAVPSRWAKWHALSPDARAAIVADYQEINRRSDARRVLESVAEFAALPAAQQERLRELNALSEEVLREQAADRRRWLRSLPGSTRGLELYRLLKKDYPERLQRF